MCGIAAVDRFQNTPKGFHPTDTYSDCKAVIVFAKRMPLGTLAVSPHIIYLHTMLILLSTLDLISIHASTAIEDAGGIAVPLPSDSPFEYWDEEKQEGRGMLSMKHAAELAGLGRIGKNTLLINPTYGNMIMLGAVLTNLPLKSDPMLEESPCINSCNICIKSCPQQALDGKTLNPKRCRSLVYGVNQKGFAICNCNKCRACCPRATGVK